VSAGDSQAGARIRVWDALVRVLHWSLVFSVATAWLTRHSPGRWHEWLGYAALVIVAARVAWGFLGLRAARARDVGLRARCPRAS
jgi:cytochrome b